MKTSQLPYFGIPYILPYAKKYKNKLIIMVILGFLSSLLDAVDPLFNRFALDQMVALHDLSPLPVFITLYMISIVIRTVSNYVCTYFGGGVEVSVNRDLRDAAFSHLQTLGFSYFNQNSVGYIHARIMSDSGKIGEMVAWRLMDTVWNGAYILSALVVMLFVNFRLFLIFVIFIPVAVLLIAYFQRRLTVLNEHVRELNSVITADFNEGITGAKQIKTLVIDDVIKKNFNSDTNKMRNMAVKAGHTSALFISTVTFLTSAILAMVLYYGGIITSEEVMGIGTLSVFISYALGILEPLQSLVRSFTMIIAIQVNIQRFFDLMNTQTDVYDRDDVIEKYGTSFEPKYENWEELIGDVEFRNVSFMYPDGSELVLKDFNLKVRAGTMVAIVGETGAGKSTLVNLVCRFFEPTEGDVLIDGRPANDRALIWLHSKLGYVLQTPYLFSGSVRDNLRYGKPKATDEEIWEALKLVSADRIVKNLAFGLDTNVGEGGDTLSTGEKQLLSFARALLSNPRILILDEATASVDTVTEKAIQDAIAYVTKGRTSFVIAHRLSTITGADVILAVQDGHITEQGTHESLMTKKGYYYELYTKQYDDAVIDQIG